MVLVDGFMMMLRQTTFAKVEDVPERLAKEHEEQSSPTAVLNQDNDASDGGGEPAEPVPIAQAAPQEQSQPNDQSSPAR